MIYLIHRKAKEIKKMNAYWNHYFFHSVESATTVPTWLLVVLGLVVIGFIGFAIYVIWDLAKN